MARQLVPWSIARGKMVDKTLLDTDAKMQKTIEALTKDLASIRTGRATPSLVENLRVDYHGVLTPLAQLATIGIPEARLIVIRPWDRTALHNIEKAILKSDLGLTPHSESDVLRLVIPPLSEERRRDLIRLVRKRIEEGKVALRNTRREAIDRLRKLENTSDISQDDLKRGEEQIQRLIDSKVIEMDHIGENKEAELLEI